MAKKYRTVVIGASAGGLAALATILSRLPEEFEPSIIIVQHIKEDDADDYRSIFYNKKCALPVKEATDKEPLQQGTVYLAPASYHLLVERNGSNLSLSVDEPVNYSRPSIDVLFESAALAFEDKLIGIILTGANNDGSEGIRKIKENGGYTMVQDPEEADAEAMPLAAIKATEIDQILRLSDIGDSLAAMGITKNKKPQKTLRVQ
ncbi:MAG: chemotaxis protein CheB [Desulfobulbaceae bacterium]|nr:chemotaxis protein CheB [Desulfobulbaceae bacterium]